MASTSEPGRSAALTSDEFTARFRACARSLWTLAAGLLGDPAEAEDLLQEAFLAGLGKLDQFEPDTNFQAWMGRFVRNLAQNERRKRARRQTESTDPWSLDDHARGTAEPRLPVDRRGGLLGDQAEFDDDLQAGLCELGDVARSCLLLKVVMDHSYAEIAGLLGIPEGTAMSHVHRSRIALRERLSGSPALDGAFLPEVQP
jgi:RNA polymerase sigma-70 factor (ECF subfamily)